MVLDLDVRQGNLFPGLLSVPDTETNGSCRRFQAVSHVALAIVHDKHSDRFLLLKRSEQVDYARWVFPGGKIEGRESAKSAAKRELFEETGLKLGRVKCHKIYQRPHPETKRIVHYVYFRIDEPSVLKTKAVATETDKSDCVAWVSLNELRKRFDGSLSEGLVQQIDFRNLPADKRVVQPELI